MTHNQSVNGTTGDIFWSFSDGILTVRGEGALTDYGFRNFRDNIHTVIIEQGVTGIGNHAFYGCKSLTSVTLPDGLTCIGNQAFYGCAALTSLTVPETVTAIGDYAFCGCAALTSLVLPHSITRLEDGTFCDCRGLESVFIPRSVTYIDNYVFSGCLRLGRITVEEGSTSYCSEGGALFSYDRSKLLHYPVCRTESHYSVPDGVRCIENGAFSLCDALTSISFPQSLEMIGARAFEGCCNLTSIRLPAGIKRIRDDSFSGCRRLEAIHVEEGGDWYCSKDGVLINKETTLERYPEAKTGADYRVPSGINQIKGSAFSHCSHLKSVTLPDGVRWIGNSAFSGCTGLESIFIPDSVGRIGKAAFRGCSSLKDMTVQWRYPIIEDIDSTVFDSRFTATCRLHIPPGAAKYYREADGWKEFGILVEDSNCSVDSIYAKGHLMGDLIWVLSDDKTTLTFSGDGAIPNFGYGESPWYEYREKIRSVTLEQGVTVIGECAFASCTALTSVSLPDSLERIEASAFSDCYKLTLKRINYMFRFAHFPDDVTAIGDRAFKSCHALEEVVLPYDLTEIGEEAFAECIRLKTVEIPDSVERIGNAAFAHCSRLLWIDMSEKNGYYKVDSGVLFSRDGSVLIQYPIGDAFDYTIPPGTVRIGKQAFGGAGFSSVAIPDSVAVIEDQAFQYCRRLKSVSIPRSVTEIGCCAFANCEQLTAIIVEEGNPSYSSVDGVLFSRDGSTLIQYPARKTGDYAISPGTVRIGKQAFEYARFSSVEIPGSVAAIEDRAFSKCFSLESISIPRSVTEIGCCAFVDGEELTAITVEEGNPSYSSVDGVLFSRDGSTLIQYPAERTDEHYSIPPGVVHIEESAFSGNNYLETVSIPEGVTAIEVKTFLYCSRLKSVAIPRSVTAIRENAFSGCYHLRDVIVRWTTPLAINEYVFGNAPFDTRHIVINKPLDTLHVPPGTKALYEAAEGWKDFKTIVEDPNVDSTEECFAAILLAYAAASAQRHATGSLTWSLSDDKTTLTIRGEGAMPDYGSEKSPWYAYQMKILTAVIEPGVTSIGTWAFFNCIVLTSVSLPDSLKRIEASAFYGCNKLPSIDIPVGVTAIGSDVFLACIALASVFLPSSLTEIGESAFAYCYSLTAVTIPRSVTKIDDRAFAYCSSLSRISVEEGNTAFSADSGVLFSRDGSVLIRYPAVKTGERYAIPPGTVRIGKQAFEGAGLSSIAIPDSVTVIEEEAFEHCSRLGSVFTPRSVTEIGDKAFDRCSQLMAFTVEEGNTSYSSSGGVLFNYDGSTLIRYPAGRTDWRYAIPRSVTAIKDQAFAGCNDLQDVTVRWATPPAINKYVFNDSPCDTLHVPPGTKALYQAADGWKDFKRIVEDSDPDADSMENTTEDITWSLSDDKTILTIRGEGTMPDYGSEKSPWNRYREKILTAVIEPGVTSIGKDAFASCTALASVSLPSSLKRIEASAFIHCRELASIDIPEGVTAIGDKAFHSCRALPAVFLPSSLTEIGERAFFYCDRLTAVTIPRSVTKIGNEAFFRCSSLSRISVEEGNAAFSADSDVLFSHDGSVLIQYPAGKTGERYAIPPRVERIGTQAFYCAHLSSVTIPDSVTVIEEEAFRNCSNLKSVIIPRSVRVIEGWAFAGCNDLQDVTVRWATPPAINKYVFNDSPCDTLHVPPGARALYEAAEGWKKFKTIVEDGDPDVEM
jgi:hypothetical protein